VRFGQPQTAFTIEAEIRQFWPCTGPNTDPRLYKLGKTLIESPVTSTESQL